MATERGTSDKTEATRFSQCAHDQRRRLEAEDCDSIRCAQLISGGRRRIRTPTILPRSRSPHNVLHSPSNWASVSEPHTCDFNATFSLLYISIYLYICDRHCTSKIAINISIFHLGSYTRRARNCPDAERSAPPIFEATAHRGRAVNLRVACALAV